MPPPPEDVQQRIDAAILDAARASRPAPPREAAPELKPAPAPAPAPAVEKQLPEQAATDTLQDTPQETPVEEEHPKTQAEVVAEKVMKEEAIAEEALPSKHQEQRWHLSKRVQERMDELLAKAAVVSHKVNNYTGTDYSGIERLRRDIIDQEQLVKAAHADVNAAKVAYTTSYSQQAASQKEVVGLLERKHSWSAADLERYMSLIRSEHLNEQAVQAAKEHLANTERHLEDARGKLEKKERKQYHEEQIWSDTIRRNSTWVTFGLMGLNIFLLLANLVIFEPWRRRRIVREIKTALDEKTTQVPSLAPVAEAEIDKVVEPVQQPLEKIEEHIVGTIQAAAAEVMPETAIEVAPDAQPEAAAGSEVTVGETPLAAGEVLPEEAVEVSDPAAAINESVEKAVEEPMQRAEPENWEERLALWKEVIHVKLTLYKAKLQDLFSERQVTVKRIDVTMIALEGAAAGVAVVGLVWALLNARS
ncbi:hypothetical protein M436DRAFT_64030 [Aureobasidium namibiae CBS 147.97]|uniref:Sensitive to high expression protein 9, mitochondrial n=1 Tax=Aureobasidium namibiae CBS 147.97 TaxID=1043004 RepID=A0A074WI96_9PEZI|nr:uncharacterized protein M436DRAFT_64030 [Aureobasidium namibiae CBS 147.97]KEQ72855.1 hypothetical protein M436DRAFT_64030 [Aureobasidium namibiae CBS 147.97]